MGIPPQILCGPGASHMRLIIRPRQVSVLAILIVLLALAPASVRGRVGASEPDGQGVHHSYLPLTIKPATVDLTISDVKIVQGITLSEPYAVKVAGRPTTVRVFVETGTAQHVDGVNGRLHGFDESGATLGGSPLGPGHGAIEAPSMESSLGRTLNFSLPTDWLIPGATFAVELDPEGLVHETDETNNRYPQAGSTPFGFTSVPPLDVTILPIEYHPFPGSHGAYLPELNDLTYLTHLPPKLLPVDEINYEIHPIIQYAPTASEENLDSMYGWPLLLQRVYLIHAAEDPHGARLYYGLVNSFDAHGCAGGCVSGIGAMGSPTSLGWTGFGAGTNAASSTFTHEMGHNFNRRHVTCTGMEGGPDPHYPYAGGAIGQWGLDITTEVLYSPVEYADFMSYCSKRWTSDYTFWHIHKYRQATQAAAPETSAIPESRLVSGLVTPSGEIILQNVYAQRAPFVAPSNDADRVRALGASGKPLTAYPLQTYEIADSGGFRGFSAFLPAIPDITGFEIILENEIRARRILTAEMDSSKFTRATLSQTAAHGGIRVAWAPATHPEARVVYRIRRSRDGGNTWQVLALDWPRTEFTLPERETGELLEIQASDGVHTSTRIVSLGT